MNVSIRTTLADAVEFLEDHGIEYALIGGLAASLRGQPRVTADVDMVIAANIEKALQLLAHVKESKFAPLFEGAAEVVEKSFILPLRHRLTGVKLDLALGLSGFERQAIQRAERVDLDVGPVKVATAEDLILMKLLAGRAHDDQDVQGITMVRQNQLDWEYCLQMARELEEAIGHGLLQRVQALRDEHKSIDD